MPQTTLSAFADHGTVARTLDGDPGEALAVLHEAQAAGLQLGTITAQLERDGVRSFCVSYQQLLDRIAAKVEHRVGAEPTRGVQQQRQINVA
jgi:transaldolase